MSEHSVIGLVVDKLDQAIETLSRHGIYVTRQEFGGELEIANFAQVSEIVEMLVSAGSTCSTGDVIDSVYQG
jgi:hypothetical protein